MQAAEPGLAGLHRFVARFHADDGLAELRTLVLDTPNVIAAGEMNVDLAHKTRDLRISPSAKRSRMIAFVTSSPSETAPSLP